ncbi:hypothetical protein [Flavobacterium wongokense]|uniref:hypothetical protein n=1 Tax=Flavobacterium wongokense TaxID=2910674 RepID=UPI001F2BEDE3|nr:hypothetical protein [Flavobacterium sp. WG47]MCF6130927.1 hypothetical protein [Flavobacterium sp. WG47]
MKKFCLLLISICLLTSCSNDSTTSNEPNPNLLQRVDFYPGTPNEKQWIFNNEGILTEIVKADGTLVQDFIYDNNNRLIGSTVYHDDSTTEGHTFTYDSNDFLTSVDGENIHYDNSLQAYYTGNLNSYYRLTKINSDKLLLEGRTIQVDNDESGFNETIWSEMLVYYSGNNVTSYHPNESCNYLTYDSNVNPLRNATLSICRAFSFVQYSNWVDGQFNSTNNVLTHSYCAEDPESSVYHYTYNSNNLPQIQTSDSYYHGVFESTMTSIKYYYQGDLLP